MTDRFRIEYRPSVEKDLRSVDTRYRDLIFERIKRLSIKPVEKGCLRIDTKKMRYRIRVGIYRVIFRVSFQERIVHIEVIRHRKDVYRDKL